MEWGWTPGTVEALATAAATLLSATAALIAVLDLRRRRLASKRVQAGLIGAWTTLEAGQPLEGMQMYDCKLHVANRSDLPILNLIVETMPSHTLGDDVRPTLRRWHTLGPGQTDDVELGSTDGHDALGYPGKALSVEFTDHAGIRWLRNDNGLTEVKRGK